MSQNVNPKSRFRALRTACVSVLSCAFLGFAVLAQSFNTVLNTGLYQPGGVAVTSTNLYIITDSGNHRVLLFNPDSRTATVFAGGEAGALDERATDARFRNPQGILYLDNRVIVSDTGNHLIREIDFSGVVKTLAGDYETARTADLDASLPQPNPDPSGPFFNSPSGLAFDPATQIIYVADTLNQRIAAIHPNKTVTTVVGSLNRPTSIALGPDNTIYIADPALHSIYKFKDGQVSRLAGGDSVFTSGLRDSLNAANALFKAPRGLYYRSGRDELIVADSGNHLLRRIFNVSSASPGVDTFANSGAAGFDNPVAITRDTGGMFLVVDKSLNALRGMITDFRPRISDPIIGHVRYVLDETTGATLAIIDPVVDKTFENDAEIVISGDPTAEHHFEFGRGPNVPTDPDLVPAPDADSPGAPNFVSPSNPSAVPAKLVQISPLEKVLKIKAISTGAAGEERVPSRIVEAIFRFQVATPLIDSKSVSGAIVFTCATEGATIWYTLDGSEPVNDGSNPNSLGPVAVGSNIPIPIGKTIRARAFKRGYKESGIAIAKDFQPVFISLGAKYGEASSKFYGSAGQRFYAPVTLTAPPNTTAYGLQFNFTVTNVLGPVINGATMAFESMLYERLPGFERYRKIPNITLAGFTNEVISNVVVNAQVVQVPDPANPGQFINQVTYFTNVVPIFTNTFPVFTNLLVTNVEASLLAVGWIERYGQDDLFDTFRQHLLSFSIPRDNVFVSSGGKIIPGGFSFEIPKGAPNGSRYSVAVGRPSATADGVSRDLYIKDSTPAETLDTNSVAFGQIPATREVIVTNVSYVVGDVAPFGWYNAGDFGDGSVLNNDMTQIQQSIGYGIWMPPPGSDFEDAMDACCITTDGQNLGNNLFLAHDGMDRVIDTIALGDKKLDFSDLWVVFRRSLDTNRVWYARHWENGEKRFTVVPNMFRGTPAGTLTALSASSSVSASTIVSGANDLPPHVTLKVANARVTPAQLLELPITIQVNGPVPVRGLMFNVQIHTAEGTVDIVDPIGFSPASPLGSPTLTFSSVSGRYGAVWLNTAVAGISGLHQLGTLRIRIPADVSPYSLYHVQLENVTASPNGVGKFPVTTINSSIIMANRPPSAWNDGINDSWRVQYFGSIYSIQSHPDLDPDLDGVCNKAEFNAGTNPLDPVDVLKLEVKPTVAKAIALRWRSTLGKNYVIETSTNLLGGDWTPLTSPIAGNGTLIQLDQGSTNHQLYYRIRVSE